MSESLPFTDMVPYAVQSESGRTMICLVSVSQVASSERARSAMMMAEEWIMEPCQKAERLIDWNPNLPIKD